ncbi:MAG: hypothetical protein KKF44_04480 [Nanoarchaeota archaeon]|nr:hypothetical protein [Nanoarchaeota archaeon]
MALETVIADMHMHSTYSDGRHTPAEIAEAVAEKVAPTGMIGVAALTDHNTVDGVKEFLDEIDRINEDEFRVVGVPGVEIEVYENGVSVLDPTLPGKIREQSLVKVYANHFLMRALSSDDKEMRKIGEDLLNKCKGFDEYSDQMYKFYKGEIISPYIHLPQMHRLREDMECFVASPPKSIGENMIYFTEDDRPDFITDDSIVKKVKSEYLVYFKKSQIANMKDIMDDLGKIKTPSFNDLITTFKENHVSRKDIALVLAHPLSVDETEWGKAMYYVAKKIFSNNNDYSRMFSATQSTKATSKWLDGIEVINAGHPVFINDKVFGNVAFPFGGLPYSGVTNTMMGNSDAHDKNWVFAAYSLMDLIKRRKQDNLTIDSVINAIKKPGKPAVWSRGWGYQYKHEFRLIPIEMEYKNAVNKNTDTKSEHKSFWRTMSEKGEAFLKKAGYEIQRVQKSYREMTPYLDWIVLSPVSGPIKKEEGILKSLVKFGASIPRLVFQNSIQKNIVLPNFDYAEKFKEGTENIPMPTIVRPFHLIPVENFPNEPFFLPFGHIEDPYGHIHGLVEPLDIVKYL